MANLKFQKLTPETDADIKVYDEAFRFVFKNDDIRNIAISGSYGSGKSSLIETYKYYHHDIIFNTISLTHFMDESTVEENDNDDGSKCSLDVNGSNIILKLDNAKTSNKTEDNLLEGQIINQIIQQIEPKLIKKSMFKIKTDKWEKLKLLFFSLIIVSFILSILGLINQSVLFIIFSTNQNVIIKSLVFVFVICLFFIVIYLVSLQINKNILKKINIKGNEIELLYNSSSYFNKYLNEILYLLEKNNCDNYIFEDIDRFDNVEIFEQLRELNKIINLRLNNMNTHRTIRFFYLIRGDLLQAKDNTKFFDFEIPVIPVMNNSNSFNKIKEWMVEAKIETKMDINFLRRACLYIDDLRLLKNIFNDFLIYIYRLEAVYSIESKLNLDFNKMFAMMIYKNIYPKDFSDLHYNKGYVYYLFQSKKEWISIESQKLENEISDLDINKHEEYIQKKNLIQAKYQLNNMNLAEVIDDADFIDFIEERYNSYKNVFSNYYYDLLNYLISSGNIDENYFDYISYFYSNDITNNDKKFLRSLTDSTSLEYTYSLDNPKLVTSFLNVADFSKIAILNLSLLNYVNNVSVKYTETALELLKREHDVEFLISFFEYVDNKQQAIESIIHVWPECASEVIENMIIEGNRKRLFILYLLSVDGIRHTQVLNKNGSLEKYLKEENNLYNEIPGNLNIDHIAIVLHMLQVKIYNIDFQQIQGDLSNYIYKDDLYSLNLNNIKSAFNKYYSNINGLNCLTDIYTEDQPLTNYVDANINTVINLFKDNNMSFKDNEETAIKILNHAKINGDTLLYYAEHVKTKIQEIDKIKNDDLWKYLVKNNCIEYTSHNILLYIKEKELDDVISEFINSSNIVIQVDDTLTNDEKGKLLDDLLVNKIVSINKFEELIQSINMIYEDFDTSEISFDKMRLLIDNKVIRMDKGSLLFLRENYDVDLLLKFIDKNIENYIVLMGSITSNNIETEHVLKSNIELDLKINYIKNLNEKIFVLNKDYCIEIVKFVIETGDYLDSDEEAELLENYTQYPEYQESILLYAKKEISNIIYNELKIDSKLKNQLMKSNISDSYKYRLLDDSIKEDSIEDIKSNLKALKLNEFIKLFEKNRVPKIELNSNNRIILQALLNKRYILDFKANDDVYRVTKNLCYSSK